MQTRQEKDLLARAGGKELTVEFVHVRPEGSAKGGCTVCYLLGGEIEQASGVSICSNEDTFNKGIGRAIALGRAFKAYDSE